MGAVEKVRIGCDERSAISATLVDESTPPDRKTPNGTSDIIRFSIESASNSRVRLTISASPIARTAAATSSDHGDQ